MTWSEWDRLSLNIPSRDNYYQMLTACQVARVLSKTPNSIQPHHFLLTFSKDKVKLSKDERDLQIATAKAHRLAWMGGAGRATVVDIHGNVLREPTVPPGGKFTNPRIRRDPSPRRPPPMRGLRPPVRRQE